MGVVVTFPNHLATTSSLRLPTRSAPAEPHRVEGSIVSNLSFSQQVIHSIPQGFPRLICFAISYILSKRLSFFHLFLKNLPFQLNFLWSRKANTCL
jgi:hypothetical protein